jgi:23S rRNA (cytidine1920-2'-O)/16S rRNA (cytidine1409-2'-O)-methyltransferase
MVRRSLVRSRGEAQDLILNGRVKVAGTACTKPASIVASLDPIEILDGPRFVSRAGAKLDAALGRFGLSVSGRRALDVGAGAGGFTDCLLQRGVESVVAVDVGHEQFPEQLRADRRVTVWEGLDVRQATEAQLSKPFDLVVADVSFISLCAVAGALERWLGPRGDLVMLVKPQFEVGKESVGRGVVTLRSARAAAVDKVITCYSASGLDTVDLMPSPVRGEHGNQEYLLWMRKVGL